jgi:hypothetical protein
MVASQPPAARAAAARWAGARAALPPPPARSPRAARSPAPAPPMAADLEAAAYALLGALFLVFAALIVLGY